MKKTIISFGALVCITLMFVIGFASEPVAVPPGYQALADQIRSAMTDNLKSETIRKGADLQFMAKTYYGDSLGWPLVWFFNTDTVANPELVEAGTKLRIPRLKAGISTEEASRALENAYILVYYLYANGGKHTKAQRQWVLGQARSAGLDLKRQVWAGILTGDDVAWVNPLGAPVEVSLSIKGVFFNVSKIFVDGKANSDFSLSHLFLTPGSHVIEIRNPNAKTIVENLNVKPETPISFLSTLEHIPIPVSFETIDNDVSVFLYNEKLGRGSFETSMMPGIYDFVFSKPGRPDLTVQKRVYLNWNESNCSIKLDEEFDQIIPKASISIDGENNDWDEIESIVSDSTFKKQKTKNLKFAQDDDYLYGFIEFNDTPLISDLDSIELLVMTGVNNEVTTKFMVEPKGMEVSIVSFNNGILNSEAGVLKELWRQKDLDTVYARTNGNKIEFRFPLYPVRSIFYGENNFKMAVEAMYDGSPQLITLAWCTNLRLSWP